jgi:hypothetical protein
MSMILNGDTGVTFNDASLQGAAASPYVLKNRIINGAMVIDQRNAGASVTPTNGQYTLDRWNANLSQASKYTVQQNAGSLTPVATTGFVNYLGVTSSSAYSVTSTDYFFLEQVIEGYNIADLGWGTASAKTVTLSFWVYSSLTGTFGGVLANSAQNRNYPYSYTVSSANTWTQISVTIAGDTSGTWLTTNAEGIRLRFGLGVGSTKSGTAGAWSATQYFSATGATSVVGTNGATFYITGVQLEIGSTATPFERRLYGQELANCQRYYYKKTGALYQTFGTGYASATTLVVIQIYHPIEMRAAPTIAMGGTLRLIEGGAVPTAIDSTQVGVTGGYIVLNSTGLTQYRPYAFSANNDTTAFLSGAAEL